jgi:hypothetical protein
MVMELIKLSLHQHQPKRLSLYSMKKYLLSMKEPTCMDLEEALLEVQRPLLQEGQRDLRDLRDLPDPLLIQFQIDQ